MRRTKLLDAGHCVALVCTEVFLYVLSTSGAVECYWLNDGLPIWKVRPTRSQPIGLELLNDTLFLATVMGEKIALDSLTGQVNFASKTTSFNAGYTCLHGDTDFGEVALGARDGTITVLQATSPTPLWTIHYGSPITAIVLSTTHTTTGSIDGMVIAWSSADGAMLWQGVAFNRVTSLAYFPPLKTVVSAGDDKNVQMWNTDDGTLKWESRRAKQVTPRCTKLRRMPQLSVVVPPFVHIVPALFVHTCACRRWRRWFAIQTLIRWCMRARTGRSLR